MKRSLAYYIPFFFVTALGLTILTAILSFYNLRVIQTDSSWVIHSREVIAQSESFYSSVRDAESETRGYFISGNQELLNQYHDSKKKITLNYQKTYSLSEGNPQQQALLRTIYALCKQRIARFDSLITIYQAEGLQAVTDATSNTPGTKIMSQITHDFSVFEHNESSLLAKRRLDLSKSIASTYVTIIVVTFLLILFICLVYFMTKRELEIRKYLEEQKDEFINMASHELKTPLTSLRVFSQVLRKRVGKDKNGEAAAIIDKIDRQVLRMRDMVADLLDLSRIQTGKLQIKKESFNIRELIDELVEVFAQTTNRHTLSVQGKQQVFVYADRYRIYQVLVNLMTNAIKYSPKGGKIRIKLRSYDSVVEISVADQGIGIDEKEIEKVFERLYQIREGDTKSIPGLGIGLYISAEIIANHKGKIWVKSKKGHGATFFFTIQKSKKRNALDPELNKGKILLQ